MRLDAWLQEQPSLYERLKLVEQLAIAVDETNRMRQPLGLLEPGRVELADDQECDLKSARGRVNPTAPYAAPERLEGAPASAESDIYSAGAIAWEVLAGRPCGDPPEHLSTACRDVARELADAIMACLERSPEWRPKDLSYVAELARAGQQAAARTAPRAARKQAARAAAAPAAAPARTVPRERRPPSAPGSRGLYLALAGVLLAGAAGLAFYILSPFGRGGSAGGSPTPAPVRPDTSARPPVATTLAAATLAPPGVAATAAPTVAARPTPPVGTPIAAAPVPTAQVPGTRPPAVAATTPTTTPATTPATGGTTTPAAVTRPPVVDSRPQPPTTTAAATLPQAAPPQATPPQAPPQTAPAQPAAPAAAPSTATVPPAATAVARPPATLTAVSPLTARRGGKVLFDLHGTGLHDGLHAAIVAVKEVPRGITIVRQKCASDTVMNVLVDIDASAAPGAYAIVLDDPAGHQTRPLTFTVAR